MILISATPAERMILSARAESIMLSAGSAKQQSTKSCSQKCNNDGSATAEARVAAAMDLMLVAVTTTAVTMGAESIILSGDAESIILSTPPAESIILSAPPADATCKHKHGASTMPPAFK